MNKWNIRPTIEFNGEEFKFDVISCLNRLVNEYLFVIEDIVGQKQLFCGEVLQLIYDNHSQKFRLATDIHKNSIPEKIIKLVEEVLLNHQKDWVD